MSNNGTTPVLNVAEHTETCTLLPANCAICLLLAENEALKAHVRLLEADNRPKHDPRVTYSLGNWSVSCQCQTFRSSHHVDHWRHCRDDRYRAEHRTIARTIALEHLLDVGATLEAKDYALRYGLRTT